MGSWPIDTIPFFKLCLSSLLFPPTHTPPFLLFISTSCHVYAVLYCYFFLWFRVIKMNPSYSIENQTQTSWSHSLQQYLKEQHNWDRIHREEYLKESHINHQGCIQNWRILQYGWVIYMTIMMWVKTFEVVPIFNLVFKCI